MWNSGRIPDQWREILIVQPYKQRGDHSDFYSQRNIHIKDCIPKFYEGIVVDKSKELMVKNCLQFQIGGLPNHRPQEYLFIVKSVILQYLYLNIPLFLPCWDVQKMFDKYILKDLMDTLYWTKKS